MVTGGGGAHSRRLGPPALDRGQCLRPRLLEVLAGRWDRRATIVVGGPGFGKSTLLAQAYAENLLAPRGTDHWFSCTPDDRGADTLLHAIGHAVGMATLTHSMDALISHLGSMPPGTCLILDDVHEITPGSEGHRLLTELVRRLPHQCSLVLGSRTPPAIGLAEWTVKGLTTALDERDLTYTPAELEQVAAARGGSPTALTDLGGWPALVELALATGKAGSDEYLRHAVLDALDARSRRQLGALHAIGGGDAELVATALGVACDDAHRAAFGELARVPATQPLEGGGIRPHALWAATLEQLVVTDERAAMQRRAASALVERGQHDAAVTLFVAAGDFDGVCAAIVHSCKTGTWRYPPHVLERWRRVLPPSYAGRPEAEALAGIAAREGATFDVSTVTTLMRAATEFRANGDLGAEAATLAEVAFVTREQGDSATFTAAGMRLLEMFASGHGEVAGFVQLFHATVAEAFDDDETVLASLADLDSLALPRQWRSRAAWLEGHSLVMLGRPEEGLATASRSYELAEDDFLGARYLQHYARWWQGVDRAVIDTMPYIADEPYRTPFDCVYGGGVYSGLFAAAGDIERAVISLDIARQAANASPDSLFARAEYAGLFALSEATIAIAQGDESSASRLLRAFLSDNAIDAPIGRRVARRMPAVVYVVVPETRAALDAANFRGRLAESLEVARWFASCREERIVPPPPRWAEHLLNALPLRWAAEAVALCERVDFEQARLATEHLVGVFGGGARDLLRDAGVTRVLEEVPVAPERPLALNVLGNVSIEALGSADVQEVDDPDVRELLAALVLRGPLEHDALLEMFGTQDRCERAVVAAQRLLEPDLSRADAAFIVRRDASALTIVGPPWIETDVARVDAELDAAHDAALRGAHTLELLHLKHALAPVRGVPLAGLEAPWAVPVRAIWSPRLAAAAARAASLSYAAGDHVGAARLARQGIDLMPSSDPAHQILVAALIARGHTVDAVVAFDAWSNARREIGLSPSNDMEMLGRRLGVVSAPSLAGIRIELMGEFRVLQDGHLVDVPAGRPQQLVKILALAGRPLTDEEAAVLLWPEASTDTGRRRLRNVLARLRAAAPLVARHGTLLVLERDVSTDVREFEHHARSALEPSSEADLGALAAALERHRGEVLPTDRFDDWFSGHRDRVAALALRISERLVTAAVDRGEIDMAIDTIERALAIDPFGVGWARRAADILHAHGDPFGASRWRLRAGMMAAS